MSKNTLLSAALLGASVLCMGVIPAHAQKAPNPLEGLPRNFTMLKHNVPDLTTDLGVGLWATPIPVRNDKGLVDLFVVGCGSPETKDVYFFENTGKLDPKTGAMLFKKGVPHNPGKVRKDGRRTSDAITDVTPSYIYDKDGNETLRVTSPRGEHPNFLQTGLASSKAKKLPVSMDDVHNTGGRLRGSNWSYVDWNNDGKLDLLVGVGDWTDYGWDDAYDEEGRWRNGPLHGYVYVLPNVGTNENPVYGPAQQVKAEGRVVDVYGNPSANFADFRGDGVKDLLTGEFVDGFTFFQNVGTPEEPKFLTGRPLMRDGKYQRMHLEMIEVVAYDWNKDGKADLVVGQEDGRVAIMRNEGFTTAPAAEAVKKKNPEAPDLVSIQFSDPEFFRQEADLMKFGVLNSPVCVDWDGDGLVDILAGNAAGEIGFFKNLGGDGPVPQFAEVQLLEADGEPIRYMAGVNGSIQGPAEAKWGYTNIGVGDWDGDGLLDVLASTIEGKIYFHKNIGTKTEPKLAKGVPLKVEWPDGKAPKPAWNWWNPEDGELVVHWRCTPYIIDLDGSGIPGLVTVDHEGYLAYYRQVEKDGKRVLLPGERIFRMRGPSDFDMKNAADVDGTQDGLLRMSVGEAGRSGRRTFAFVDWDGDGKLDLLVNSLNIDFLKNVSTKPGEWVFENMGPIDGTRLAGHSTAPAPVDWDGNGIPDLVVGAEDGFFFFLKNPLQKADGEASAGKTPAASVKKR